MVTVDNIREMNAIEEEDFVRMTNILYESLLNKRLYKKQFVIEYKENIVESLIDLLKKMLSGGSSMSKQKRLSIINTLDKLKTQKEYFELMRSGVSVDDIQQASKRLGKKTQSSFSQ